MVHQPIPDGIRGGASEVVPQIGNVMRNVTRDHEVSLRVPDELTSLCRDEVLELGGMAVAMQVLSHC